MAHEYERVETDILYHMVQCKIGLICVSLHKVATPGEPYFNIRIYP